MALLPEAPPSLIDEVGLPRFGAYAGRVREASFARLAPRYRREGVRRLTGEKTWHYVCVLSPSLVVAGAVVQLGYLSTNFLYVFDRREKRLLADRALVLPPMLVDLDDNAAEARGSLRRVRSRMVIEASNLAGRFFASLPGLSVEITLRTEQGPQPLTAICPVGEDGLTLTQKTTCVPAVGEVRVGAATHRLRDAYACLDYSHGFLLRETRWRWASGCGRLADGRMLGLNLVEGHNDVPVTENALWVDGRLVPVGRTRFEFERGDPLRPWGLRSEDGRVDLRFEPEGVRRQNLDLKVLVSEYAQPIGTFSGVVRAEGGESIEVAGLPGVTENHRSVW